MHTYISEPRDPLIQKGATQEFEGTRDFTEDFDKPRITEFKTSRSFPTAAITRTLMLTASNNLYPEDVANLTWTIKVVSPIVVADWELEYAPYTVADDSEFKFMLKVVRKQHPAHF